MATTPTTKPTSPGHPAEAPGSSRVRRPPADRRRLALASLLLLLVGALADAWSVGHHLPYALGGHGSPDRVAQDWVSNGTALGPPLSPLVVIVLAAPLALARRWWGAIGDVLLTLVAAAMLAGTIGEPTARTVFEPHSFDAVQALFRVATVGAALTVLALSLAGLIRRAGRRGGR